jgi:hypothetical protein
MSQEGASCSLQNCSALQTVRQRRLQRTRETLQCTSFLARKTFCAPLLEIGSLLDSIRGIKVCCTSLG